jgi:saccharopine dehydrogenase (NAD+, L-lysine-forming)
MIIGIRREDKSQWEARSPIIPEHVTELLDTHGIEIRIQPSEQRIFSSEEYIEAGAIVTEDLGACNVILGVKEIPSHFFERGKTYLFFSHTIKGQPYNMGMLRRMMQLECNLIDYETVTDDDGRRLVFFGVHAGLAGMIDSLWALGRRLQLEGRQTPLTRITPAHQYESLKAAKQDLAEIATEIASSDALAGCGPIVCGFAGYGRVAEGAQEIYDIFGPKSVAPGELASIDVARDDGQFFKVVFKEEHMVEPKVPGATFELQDYYKHPQRYHGVFERYLPHLIMLINCIFWTPDYPRLVTKDGITALYHGDQRPRLKVIGDISCDPEGSIECTVRPTDPGNPVYVYNVDQGATVDGFNGHGPVILAVEILPTELPREASYVFSNALLDMIPGLAASDPSGDFESWNLPAPLKRAVILHKGRFTEKYAYMQKFLT